MKRFLATAISIFSICLLPWSALAQTGTSAEQLYGRQFAQAGKPTAATKPAQPDANAKPATYGDWQLRCQAASATPPAPRICEITQAVMLKDQTAPFAQIAFGRPTPSEPIFVTVVVPLNVSFPSSVRIATGDADPLPAELAWRRCTPGGCFANLALKDELLKRWRALETTGRVVFKSAGGQDVQIPISFRGLAQALDALAKQP